MTHIAIIVGPHDRFEERAFLLREIAEVWRAGGDMRVSVVDGASDLAAEDADLAILHPDLTIVPQRQRAIARRYPRVLNGQVIDISKRRICGHRVRRDDGYDGPVIVKSNFNSGGARERLAVGRGSRLRRRLARLRYPTAVDKLQKLMSVRRTHALAPVRKQHPSLEAARRREGRRCCARGASGLTRRSRRHCRSASPWPSRSPPCGPVPGSHTASSTR